MNSSRFLPLFGVLATLATLPVRAAGPIPRTADGHPDLQGFWTNVTLTPMERPAQFAGKVTLSDPEAQAYEKKDLETNNIDNPEAPLLARAGSTETGGYNNLFIDRGRNLRAWTA